LKRVVLLLPLLLTNCENTDDRLNAAAPVFGRAISPLYAPESYSSAKADGGLKYTFKNQVRPEWNFILTEPQKCVFVYDRPGDQFKTRVEINYNLLDMGNPVFEPATIAPYVDFGLKGLPDAVTYTITMGRPETKKKDGFSVGSIDPGEVDLYRRRVARLREFCPGRS
jgi:hypothetical protein